MKVSEQDYPCQSLKPRARSRSGPREKKKQVDPAFLLMPSEPTTLLLLFFL